MSRETYDDWLKKTRKKSDSERSNIEAGKPPGDRPPPVPSPMTDELALGDRFSFYKDGIIYTDRVESVRYDSGSPAVYRRLNRWQRMVRRLTPPRWRKPLLLRSAVLSSITINGENGDLGKTITQIEQMKRALEDLTRKGPNQ